jgi:hypothetical protein
VLRRSLYVAIVSLTDCLAGAAVMVENMFVEKPEI